MQRRFNTPLWSGLILIFVAVFSYLLLFVRWPITRDVPWVTFLLFAVALALLVIGFRRAQRKIAASIVLAIGVGLIGFFTVGTLVLTKNLPQSQRAPAIGQKAPDFTLPDSNHKPVALSQFAAANRGVLLIFYRGYW
jgi:hypothetical protein